MERQGSGKMFRKLLKTVAVFTGFFSLGCSCVLVGTTMIDMKEFLRTDTKTIAAVFTGNGIGRLFGAILSGVLFDRFCAEIQISVACLLQAVFLGLAPWVPHLTAYFTFALLNSIAYTYFNASSQPFMISLWAGHRWLDPVIQASEAVFSIGATVGPFLVGLFVTNDIPLADSADVRYNVSGFTADNNIIKYTEQALQGVNNVSNTTSTYKGNVQYAFVSVATIFLIPAISFLLFFIIGNEPFLRPKLPNNNNNNRLQHSEAVAHSRFLRPTFFTLMLLMNFSYLWIEVSFGGYVTVYASQGLGYEKRLSVLCASVFYGALGCGRLLGIPISTRMRERSMLAVNFSLLALGLSCLLFVHHHPSVLWVGTALTGFGMSTVFATQILWCSKQIAFKGRAAAVVHTGVSLGVMCGPAVTGLLFQTLGHQWLIYLVMMAGAGNVATYVCMELIVRHMLTNSQTRVQFVLKDKSEIKALTDSTCKQDSV